MAGYHCCYDVAVAEGGLVFGILCQQSLAVSAGSTGECNPDRDGLDKRFWWFVRIALSYQAPCGGVLFMGHIVGDFSEINVIKCLK